MVHLFPFISTIYTYIDKKGHSLKVLTKIRANYLSLNLDYIFSQPTPLRNFQKEQTQITKIVSHYFI